MTIAGPAPLHLAGHSDGATRRASPRCNEVAAFIERKGLLAPA